MNKYKNKIPRDDLKRFAKEIAKKLVASDYKAGRVKDPTRIDERQGKKVKEFCKQFFERAYHKHKKQEAEKSLRDKAKQLGGEAASPARSPPAVDDNEDVKMSDNEDDAVEATSSVETPSDANGAGTLKRKRAETSATAPGEEEERESTGSPLKRLNLEIDTPLPPPPPPAPPVETPPASTPCEDDNEGEDVDMDTDIHADTNFKGRSMADVLAQAQAECGDDGNVAGDAGTKNGNSLGGDWADEESDGRASAKW